MHLKRLMQNPVFNLKIYKQNWHYTIKIFEHQARAVLYNIPWHTARELCNGPRNEILD